MVPLVSMRTATPGRELQVHGSGVLLRWLLERDLVDELNLRIYPVIVGDEGVVTLVAVGEGLRDHFEAGMRMAVQGNIRVAAASMHDFGDALRIAYRSGTITGMLTDGLGLLTDGVAQRSVQQVGGGVVAHRPRPELRIDFAVNGLATA